MFIDDDKSVLRALSYNFNNPDIAYTICNTVEEALEAIKQYSPEVIFLDNHFTKGGNEGLEVADKLKDTKIKIYSTTTDPNAMGKYAKRSIEGVAKFDFNKIREIINKK